MTANCKGKLYYQLFKIDMEIPVFLNYIGNLGAGAMENNKNSNCTGFIELNNGQGL